MSEVHVKLKIRGVDAQLQPAGSVVEVPALVDTGASRTILNTRVAREAGVVLTDLPGNVSGIGGTMSVKLGVAVLAVHECGGGAAGAPRGHLRHPHGSRGCRGRARP